MGVPGNANTLLLKSAAAGGGAYEISRSLRFNPSDTPYLQKVFSGNGSNPKIRTFSCWVKRSGLGSNKEIFSSSNTRLSFDSDTLYAEAAGAALQTTQVFRDVSAWYHILFAWDTTQATSSNRSKLYVNGAQVTNFSSANYPTQNADSNFATTTGNSIIGQYQNIAGYVLDGYLADIHFIDGQALDPSSFTDTDATTGQLVPKAFTGSYGTNGFRLAFDSYATTAALGTDSSGAGNTWSVNNLSVTAGSGNDSLVDTPTSYGTDTGAGGEVRGNYCTWNPLKKVSSATAVNGNLAFTVPADGGIASTFAVSSGKWYWEVVLSSGRTILGLATTSWDPAVYPGNTAQGWGYSAFNGNKIHNASSTSYGSSFTTGDVIGVAFDADAGTLTFYKNGTSQGQAFSGITGSVYQPALGGDGGTTGAGDANFGQRAFAYTAPSGFKALVDTNLPTPVVAKGSAAMDVKLYTGNGSTQSITGLNFNPDFVWLKSRSSGSYSHNLYDAVRGATKILYSDSTSSENTDANGLTAFNSDGFSLGNTAATNASSTTYVGWCWDAGTTTVSNSVGSITASLRANTAAGFSIATFTTNSSSGNATIGHGLGVAPKFVIVKSRNATYNWDIYHGGISNAKDGRLTFTTAAFTTSFVPFGGVDPTSSVFTLSQSFYGTGIDCVAYAFSPVSGYSSFGSYTGNGSSDGPFVYTGHKPRWLMIKCSSIGDAYQHWHIFDTARSGYNVTSAVLQANTSTGEGSFAVIDLLSNGFKIKYTDSFFNQSGSTWIFASFAENPFQYARAR